MLRKIDTRPELDRTSTWTDTEAPVGRKGQGGVAAAATRDVFISGVSLCPLLISQALRAIVANVL